MSDRAFFHIVAVALALYAVLGYIAVRFLTRDWR